MSSISPPATATPCRGLHRLSEHAARQGPRARRCRTAGGGLPRRRRRGAAVRRRRVRRRDLGVRRDVHARARPLRRRDGACRPGLAAHAPTDGAQPGAVGPRPEAAGVAAAVAARRSRRRSKLRERRRRRRGPMRSGGCARCGRGRSRECRSCSRRRRPGLQQLLPVDRSFHGIVGPMIIAMPPRAAWPPVARASAASDEVQDFDETLRGADFPSRSRAEGSARLLVHRCTAVLRHGLEASERDEFGLSLEHTCRAATSSRAPASPPFRDRSLR